MAKTVKTSSTKGRETKLSKKSNEELIQIILRKDKLERNLNAQVVSLKAEVNSLSSRVNNFDKDMEGTVNEVKNLRDSNKVSREQIDSLRIRLKDEEENRNKNDKYIVELEENNHSLKTYCVFSTILVAITAILCWVLF